MRPRYLEIEGLQSFKELQRVDFDKLSETGLFGIFGPTGSGKSTILDAITLALYGSVHRAAKGTQGIINTDMGGIKVAFTFDLTKEGLRKTYRVERQYKRKKDSESSAEAKLVRLLEIAEEQEYILADKHNEVNSFIVQLVGLKFEDFTRSVVLPQNKFQEFLLSPRGEKTKMLERIFYLEEYGRRLGDKFNREMAAAKNRLSNVEGALSTLGNSSPEALIETERKMEEAHKHRMACADRLKAAEQSYGQGMELHKLSKEQDILHQKLEEYQSKEAEMKNLQVKVSKSENANHIKPIIIAYKEAKAGCLENTSNLSELLEKLKELEAVKGAAQQKYDAALQQKDSRLPELIKYTTMLQECQLLRQEVEALAKQLDAARREYEEIKAHMEAAKKTAAEKTQEKDALSKEILELEQKSDGHRVDNEYRKQIGLGLDLEKELLGLENALKKQGDKCLQLQKSLEEYQQKHEESLASLNQGVELVEKLQLEKQQYEASRPMNREEIAEQQGKVLVVEGIVQNMFSIFENIKGLDAKLDEYKSQTAELAAEQQKAEQNLLHAVNEKDSKQKLLDTLLEQQKQHTAAVLAEALRHGEQCPVCGSLEHPNPAKVVHEKHDDDMINRQKHLQAAIEEDQLHIKELEHQLIKLKQQQSSILHIIEQTTLDHQHKTREHQNLRSGLPDELQAMDHAHLQAAIASQKESLIKASQEFAIWEQKAQQLSESIKQKESGLSEVRLQEHRLAALLDSNRTAMEQEQKQLEEQKRSMEEAATKYNEMRQGLKLASFSQEAEIIGHKDEQSQTLAAALRQQRSRYEVVIGEVQTALEKINEITNLLSTKKSEGLKLREQKEEKEKKIAGIIGEKNLELELLQVKKETEILELSYKTCLEELERANKALEEIQRRKAALQSSLDYFREKLEAEGKRLTAALESKGFASQEEAEACMLTEEMIKQHQEEILKYSREKGSLEDRLKSVVKQLDGKHIDEVQWQQLCSEYELIKQELENSISQQETARNNYQQIKENFERWLKLQEELKGISKKKDMLEQIQKLLKGSAFIEFISEERMRYIAREASETLGELTKFRYSIELDTENGFVIRDNANGGVLRSVASLSGGETFLTSLSLALALSSQLQLKGQSPLEFFFLDEGFGTLDNTLLDTVIDSLERLSSSKRVIGLISHVPEMKNRITRRLIIEAPDRTGKGSRISIEKA